MAENSFVNLFSLSYNAINYFFLSVLILMCIPINVNNIVYSCNICHVNVNNKDPAAQCVICQSWVIMKCNKLNHIDYKYLQGSNDPWYCLSCCSNIFPFGTQTNKDFISSITTTNSFSQSNNSDNDKETSF